MTFLPHGKCKYLKSLMSLPSFRYKCFIFMMNNRINTQQTALFCNNFARSERVRSLASHLDPSTMYTKLKVLGKSLRPTLLVYFFFLFLRRRCNGISVTKIQLRSLILKNNAARNEKSQTIDQRFQKKFSQKSS